LNILGDNLLEAITQITERAEYKGRILEFNWAVVQQVGRVAVIRDITRQVEVDRAKDALLGSVSHELRTPLTAIGGFAEVIEFMAKAVKGGESIASYAIRIKKNVGRLTNLVNSLLDHAQMQAGALKLLWQDVSLPGFFRELDELMSGMATEKGLGFRIDFDEPEPGTVQADKERLEQIFVNLIGNAIKFTEKGSVSIRVYLLPGERWGASVIDTGAGIPPAQLPDIFLPFRRGSDYATRARQGAGLGLSISKNLAEMMGGEVNARSELGAGTTLSVAFPIRARAHQQTIQRREK
jgi:signal transduction histidine kinase